MEEITEEETRTLHIIREGLRLYVNAPFMSKRMELRPLSETRFDTGGFVRDELRFGPGEGTEGSLTLISQDGQDLKWRKSK